MISTILIVWVALAAISTLHGTWRWLLQRPFVKRLSAEAPQLTEADGEALAPLLSVIVAARNEGPAVGETLRSIAAQNYPTMEMIVVNDRSTDDTGAVMRSVLQEPGMPPARYIEIKELLEGWLGKNHAMYRGYQEARGTVLLFTDADIRFHPNALAAAYAAMRREQADHLTAAPRMLTPSFGLGLFIRFFLFSLGLLTEPWFANDPARRNRYMGIGAFNLITRSAYEGIGTHRALAYRPDDDLRLGKLIKESGRRQLFLNGDALLEVEWYPSLREAFRGFEKNVFAGLGYRYWAAAGAAAGQLAMFVLPLPAGLVLLLTKQHLGAAVLLLAVYLGQCLLGSAVIRSVTGLSRARTAAEVLLHPWSALFMTYAIVRSAALTAIRGGMYWRGTFYSIRELRRHR